MLSGLMLYFIRALALLIRALALPGVSLFVAVP